LLSLTTGTDNTATGFSALKDNTTGNFNTAFGSGALDSNTEGFDNVAIGAGVLGRSTTGISNVAIGDTALDRNTVGNGNTAVGVGALSNSNAAFPLLAAGFNTALGLGAGENVTTASNVIVIGAHVPGANLSNTCFIGNIFGNGTPDGAAVLISENGRLGTLVSSRRFKDEIKPMEKASETLFALKPVTFRYKKEIDPVGIAQFGLVAEEVEKVNPDLVVRDKEGKPYSVRYEQVNAMLLNEFLKEHRTVQELKSILAKQEATIAQQQKDSQATAAQQQKQIETLTAGLQKVSAQLEVSKPAPQTVLNSR
jgi:hypothetical protein